MGWTPLIALHAAGATLALFLGAVVIARPTKGDQLHRRLGRIWAVDVYWVAFSSFGIRRLHPGHFSYLHLLSVWSIISITLGVWAARAHRRELHRGFMVGTYVGLVIAGLAASTIPVRLIPHTAVRRPLDLVLAVLGIACVAAVTVAAARHTAQRDSGVVQTVAVDVARPSVKTTTAHPVPR